MKMTRLLGRRTLSTSLVGLLAACSGGREAADPVPDGGPWAQLPDAGGGDDGGVQDAAPVPVTVSLSAAEPRLCAGDCTTLSALVSGGAAELRWSAELGSDERVEVCPSATTSYTVTALSHAADGAEFEGSHEEASATLTISVEDCTEVPSERVICELRRRFRLPDPHNPRDPQTSYVGPSSMAGVSLAAAPDGSLRVVSGLQGRVDLGAGAVGEPGSIRTLVHAVDGRCGADWTVALAPRATGDFMVPTAAAVDAQGNTVVVSAVGPLVDVNPFLENPVGLSTELIVDVLSPTGVPLARASYPVAVAAMVGSIAFGAGGRVFLSGVAHAFTDFGTGPLGVSPTAVHTFMLELDAQLTVVDVVRDANVAAMVAHEGSLYTGSASISRVDFLDILTGQLATGATGEYTRRDAASGDVLWSVPGRGPFSPLAAGGIAFAELTQELTPLPDGSTRDREALSLVRVDDAGREASRTLLASYDSDDAGVDPSLMPPPLVVSLAAGAGERVAMVVWAFGATTLNGVVLDASTDGFATTFVTELDAGDRPMWSHALDRGETMSGGPLVRDARGDLATVYGVGVADPTGAASTQNDLVLLRLRGGS